MARKKQIIQLVWGKKSKIEHDLRGKIWGVKTAFARRERVKTNSTEYKIEGIQHDLHVKSGRQPQDS